MSRQLCLVLLTIMLLPILIRPALAGTASAAPLPTELTSFIDSYIGAYNARNADGILAMYADDAKISYTKGGKPTYLSKGEYVPVLKGKLSDAERKGQSITGWEILAANVGENQAELKVKINGKRWIFTGSETGVFHVEKRGGVWKIVKDDL